jgi:hypothetical protein
MKWERKCKDIWVYGEKLLKFWITTDLIWIEWIWGKGNGYAF